MLFTEFRYLAFFLVAFAVHWGLKRDGARKNWLLLCSYVFYGAWDWRFCSLILLSTFIDYNCGRMLVRPDQATRRRLWVTLSVCANLGLLGFFKYYNFFVESGEGLFTWLGLDFPARTLDIVLPVGISFYTFQTLSYTIDIYRGNLRPVTSLRDFALFVGFFPQLVAGPIVRAVDFLPQLSVPRRLAGVDVRACLTLFLIGFVKKACVSDNLAVVVDEYFASPAAYDVVSSWQATFYYAVQIYCDFSGYSDMAIASAGLLGYELCINFRFPFFATNIGDFWRRWHVSLSSWLRDYLYIPLGGNRGSRPFTYRNLTLTLVLCGFWHGAGWNYIVFGALHAAAVIARVEWRAHRNATDASRPLADLVGVLLTFWFFAGTLIVFRPSGLAPTLEALRAYALLDTAGTLRLETGFAWLFPALAVVHLLAWRRTFATAWERAPTWVAYGVLGAGSALALQFAARDYQPFLYFQF